MEAPYPFCVHADDGLKFIKNYLVQAGAWTQPLVQVDTLPVASKAEKNKFAIMQDATTLCGVFWGCGAHGGRGVHGGRGDKWGSSRHWAQIPCLTASCQEDATILRSEFDDGVRVYLLDEEFLQHATVVQRDTFVGVNSMLRAWSSEQYFATRDGMYYLITIGGDGPVAWWLRRARSCSSSGFQGYAADVKFAGEHLNGFVLRSGLYEDLGGGDLKVAPALVQ